MAVNVILLIKDCYSNLLELQLSVYNHQLIVELVSGTISFSMSKSLFSETLDIDVFNIFKIKHTTLQKIVLKS